MKGPCSEQLAEAMNIGGQLGLVVILFMKECHISRAAPQADQQCYC